MKKLKINKPLLLLFTLLTTVGINSRAQEDSVKSEQVVKLQYFNNNNNIQYLLLQSLLKTGKKSTPQQNKSFQIFLDSNKTENLISKVLTDNKGKAKAIIPAELKDAWNAAPQHKFIVVADATGKEEATPSEFTITKAKISIDTSSADSIKSISVRVTKYENDQWVPVKDVEMKIGVARYGGILSAGDEATYTTDSTGTATSEFKKNNLPGDEQGNLILAAKVEDNDELGNLIVEKAVPWGIVTKTDNSFFDQRTLWSTRFRTPFWLLFMAYSIVIGVWGTLIYLVIQLIKIKKLSTSPSQV